MILFAQYAWEVTDHCVQSAIQVRQILTDEMNTRALKDLRTVFTSFVDAMNNDAASGHRLNGFGLGSDYDIEVVGRLRQVVPDSTDWFFLNFHHNADAYRRVDED